MVGTKQNKAQFSKKSKIPTIKSEYFTGIVLDPSGTPEILHSFPSSKFIRFFESLGSSTIECSVDVSLSVEHVFVLRVRSG